ncbi:MAG: M1 family aminopeptidase, partial [Vicinamibacterales bacterium]
LIYEKGAWVLHMLRGIVGTEGFWRGIREYYGRYRDGNATTADFRRVMEEVHGGDLRWFFDQWLTRARSPSFDGGWRYDAARHEIDIDLRQTQPGDAYRVPLEFGITVAGDPVPTMRVERVEMTGTSATFHVASSTPPQTVTFDPGTWLLAGRSTFGPR